MTQALTIGQAVSYHPGQFDFISRRTLMTQHGDGPLHAVVGRVIAEDRATLSVLDHSGVWHTREAVAFASVDDPEWAKTGYFTVLLSNVDAALGRLEQAVAELSARLTTATH